MITIIYNWVHTTYFILYFKLYKFILTLNCEWNQLSIWTVISDTGWHIRVDWLVPFMLSRQQLVAVEPLTYAAQGIQYGVMEWLGY